MLGMLSPASRGSLMTAAITLYVCLGAVAGYFSARVYKTLKGREWKRAAFLVSKMFYNCCKCELITEIAYGHINFI